jgi:NAD(P)-dependent dehydrogenase (short-subunit alcohol dehydrogenase family)
MATPSPYAHYPSLADKVVFITGGAQGIGAAAVEHFAHQRACVAFFDLADNPARDLVHSLTPQCPRAPLFLHCDLSNPEALQSAIAEAISMLGPPSALINNAANDDRHRFDEVTPAYWDDRIAVNLRHQFFAAQAVAASMKSTGLGGSIINMSSIAWLIPTPEMTVYNMAKAAVVALTKSLARELGPHSIRVNSVLPGAILTERQRRLYFSPEYEQRIMASQSLKRHIQPEEVARLILFLASDDSSAITGQSHIIDAGWV